MPRIKLNPRRRFQLLFLPMCFLLFAYPVNRLSAWAGGNFGAWQTVVLWLAAAAGLWISFRSPKMLLRFVLVHWMGIGFIVLTLTLVYEMLRFLVPADDRAAVIAILVIAAVLSAMAIGMAFVLRVKHLQFRTPKVTRAHRMVQISDVHIGSRQGGYLRRVVNCINSLTPDVVVITGDLVDTSAVGEAELQSLAALRAPVFFSIGNHERYADLQKVLAIVARLGVQTLRQQSAVHGEIQFIGIDDADDRRQVARRLPGIARRDNFYDVLLYHRPTGWTAAREGGVDLMLSGHTHNGQIFPFNWLVKRQFKRICGLYRKGESYLYVSPGTGTWGPLMRLGSRNEVTCVDVLPVASV